MEGPWSQWEPTVSKGQGQGARTLSPKYQGCDPFSRSVEIAGSLRHIQATPRKGCLLELMGLHGGHNRLWVQVDQPHLALQRASLLLPLIRPLQTYWHCISPGNGPKCSEWRRCAGRESLELRGTNPGPGSVASTSSLMPGLETRRWKRQAPRLCETSHGQLPEAGHSPSRGRAGCK